MYVYVLQEGQATKDFTSEGFCKLADFLVNIMAHKLAVT